MIILQRWGIARKGDKKEGTIISEDTARKQPLTMMVMLCTGRRMGGVKKAGGKREKKQREREKAEAAAQFSGRG